MYRSYVLCTCTELIKPLRVKMFAQSCLVDLLSNIPCVSISNIATLKNQIKKIKYGKNVSWLKIMHISQFYARFIRIVSDCAMFMSSNF